MLLSIYSSSCVKSRCHMKALHKEVGLTQEELVKRLNEGQAYTSRIELGGRYVDMLFYINWCHACGFSPIDGIRLLEEPLG